MPTPSYRFGPFHLDPATHELRRNGEFVALTGKTFDTLALLLQHHDRVVLKDELIRAVWPDSFVSEDSLTQNISALRRALGDDPAKPKYIATVARRGYRFIATLDPDPAEPGPTPATPDATHTSAALPSNGFDARRTHASLKWVAIAAIAAVAGLAGGWRFGASSPPVPPLGTLRFTEGLPPGTSLASGGVVSPDSKYLVFAAQDENSGKTQLWLRSFDSADSRPLPGTESASRPFWAPDSQSIGFFAESRIKRVGLGGESPQTLAPTIGAQPAGGSWSSNGLLIYSDTGAIYSLPASGGEPKVLREPNPQAQELALRQPQFLPDGRHFIFLIASQDPDRAGTYVGSLDASEATRLLDGSRTSVTYATPGYLVYVREHVLMAQRFDPTRLTLAGEPRALAVGVSANPIISASSAGMLTFGGGITAERLAWFDESGQRGGTINVPTVLHNLSLSPNQRQLIGSSAEPDQGGLWMVDLDRGVPTRLIPDGGGGVWSGDGTRIVFSALRQPGSSGIYIRTLAGRGDDELLLATNEAKILNDWSRDGRFIVYVRADLKTRNDLWVLPTEGDRKPYAFVASGANEIQGQVSPDGKWIAYASDESGAWEVYLQTFPMPGAKRRISVSGGTEPQWRSDGRTLYYLARDYMMMAVEVKGSVNAGAALEIGRPRQLFRAPVLGSLANYRNYYAVSADGQRFVIDSVATGTLQEPVTLMLNWAP